MADILTPTQLTVLTLLAGGLSYAEVAYESNIALPTIKSFISSKKQYGQSSGILERLNVSNTTAAVVVALKWGILQLDDIEVKHPVKYSL